MKVKLISSTQNLLDVIYTGATNDIASLKPTDTIMSHQTVSSYYVNTWQMGMNM